MKITYTWRQTPGDIIIAMKIANVPDLLRVIDISFTSKKTTISISGIEKHVITFHDLIQKEKSHVHVQNSRNTVMFKVVKQVQDLWPTLEASVSDDVPDCEPEPNCVRTNGCDRNEQEDERNCNDRDGNKGGNKTLDKDGVSNGKMEIEKIEQRQPEFMDKDEEPVYHLDHLKHDFFHKGSILTLQVFAKSVNKDAVKIVFSDQGFVLKFCTSDQKFLQLHERTTADTTFSWTVKTWKDIVPDECKVKVKSTVIEILLYTVTTERWTSLEAPSRKVIQPSKSDAWMPVQNGTLSQPKSSLESSTKSETSAQDSISGDNKKVMFDEMADVDVLNKAKRKPVDKPTAKVQPLNKKVNESTAVVSPGYAGLVNFGNTCFMNCVIQVLSNTREFKDYFLDGRFEEEINEDNPLGMKGHLAATFGIVLRWLWSCQKYCWEPRKLKDLISKKNPQFFGFAQHDAHEFLAFLLDGLHEDLNRIRQKPYTETIDSNGRPDEVVAAEAWAQYKQRNDSVVVDLFQGQYKSKLVCPKCGKVSITFDPFLYLSVPLPKRKKLIHVTFIWKEFYKKPIRYHIQVCHDSTIERVLVELSERTGCKSIDIRVFESYKGRIHKFFPTGASLAYVDDKSFIIACEVLSEELAGEEVIDIPVIQRTLSPSVFPTQCAACDKYCNEGTSLKRCTNCYRVGYCNHTCQRKHWTIHKSQCSSVQQAIGCPFIISLPASRLTYGNVMKQMEGFSRFSVSLFQPPVKSTESITKQPISSTASPSPPSNLSSSLSQSSSSLNSLDSLSSASSTCTLTGDQSDTQIPEEGSEVATSDSSEGIGSASLSSLNDTTSSSDNLLASKASTSTDSGLDCTTSTKSDKGVPTSQVMGVPAKEAEREKAWPTFLMQPASSEGTSLKSTEWIEDKGDMPLGLPSGRSLAMVWRNDEKLPSYVLVQSKELEAEEVDEMGNMNNVSNMPTLYQCLELFTEPEVLSQEEAWFCPSCKKHVEASKQMAIWKLPHTLVIQLKRFSFQSFIRRSKIEKRVEFPIRGLDLRRYCVGLSPDEPSPVYDLYGVVNHHGHLIDGHYTSYVRCTSDELSGTDQVGWRLCDDSRVTSVDNEKFVVTKDAYLLFYRRRGMPAVINCSRSDSSQSHMATTQATSVTSATIENIAQASFLSEDEDMRIPAYSQNSTLNTTLTNARNANSNNARRVQPCPASQTSSQFQANNVTAGSGDSSRLRLDLKINGQGVRAGRLEVDELGEKSDKLEVDPIEEKGDREKEFFDCGVNVENNSKCSSHEDDDEPRLVIQTDTDLGYTDMEAVD